jgi:hypothetical protein
MPRSSANAAPAAPSGLRRFLPDLVILPTIALLLSAIMTWANVGFGPQYLARWGASFLTSLVFLPVILVFVGVLDKVLGVAVAALPWLARKLVVAAVTACFIESTLALAVTAINGTAGNSFGQAWWLAFSRSLPAGFVISLFFVFYMKPKMERMRAAAAAR